MVNASSVSPFAPETLAKLPAIEGVAFATAEAGIRDKKRTDLLVAVFDEGTSVAGVLTQSKTASAPVLACRKHLKKGAARALVVNSGNANAFTGKKGSEAVEITVADTGHGVTRELKEKLFLPYFSTKQRGTGLGLSIVSRIVEDHHGSIRVEENHPVGTRFIVELPVVPESTPAAAIAKHA